MSENGTVAAIEETDADMTTENTANTENAEEPIYSNTDEISYHAVEKEGTVTAIWEMQGPVHLRTIDPRSGEGKKILSLFETAA